MSRDYDRARLGCFGTENVAPTPNNISRGRHTTGGRHFFGISLLGVPSTRSCLRDETVVSGGFTLLFVVNTAPF